MGLKQSLPRTLGRVVLIAGLVAAAGDAALCQDQSAATPQDAINARKLVMDTIDDHMNAIEEMTNSGKPVDLAKGNEHADTISVLLSAFPHLFPPSTNLWKAGGQHDPAADTDASPDIWKNFADFYKLASGASKLAYDASRAKQDGDFKKAAASLRTDCNACHSAFMKTD